MTRFAPSRAKLADSRLHGADAELLLVEGDSALASVSAVRHERTQAVLAFQGKPLNAWAASAERVDRHAPYRLLAEALGLPSPTAALTDDTAAATLRYGRVALLFDPDADGIHIGALLMLYVQRWLPLLINQGRLLMLRAPMFEIVSATDGEVHLAYHPTQCQAIVQRLRQATGEAPRVQAHRGLGSIAPSVLRAHCLDPATRNGHVVTAADAQAAAAVFGGAS